MRRLGLLGGMSWESTALYYKLLNEGVRERRGGLHSAPLILWSFDFAGIADRQAAGAWDDLGAELGEAGRRLAGAGAEALLLCTNTMHRLYDTIAARSGVPVLHIADAAGRALAAAGCRRPAVLGTRFTMEQDFYTGRLAARHGLHPLVPEAEDRATIHDVIYRELCRGRVEPASKRAYLAIVDRMARAGADAVVLGCTEITLLLGQDDVALPVFDTTALHAAEGVAFMLDEG